jgi:hypothetical protein
MDARVMEQWAAAWKQFPWEAGKWAAKMVNDMAFEYRAVWGRGFPQLFPLFA